MDPSNFIAPFYDDSTEYQDQDYSYGKALVGGLFTYKNMERLLKIAECGIYSTAIGYLSTNKQISNEVKIYTACTSHKISKINQGIFELYFGDLLLTTSRNIAHKDVIRNEADKLAYLELRESFINALKENTLESLIGYDQSKLSSEFLETIQKEVKPKSARTNGVCLSSSYYFIEKVLNSPELNEAILISLAQEMHKGVPAKVAAIHEIYDELFRLEKKTNEHFSPNEAISHLYGKVDLEGANNTRSTLLKALKGSLNFKKLELGIYEITFDLGSNNEGHSLVYVKLSQNEGYFFDSNVGLIKCANVAHESVFDMILDIYRNPISINSITKVSKV